MTGATMSRFIAFSKTPTIPFGSYLLKNALHCYAPARERKRVNKYQI